MSHECLRAVCSHGCSRQRYLKEESRARLALRCEGRSAFLFRTQIRRRFWKHPDRDPSRGEAVGPCCSLRLFSPQLCCFPPLTVSLVTQSGRHERMAPGINISKSVSENCCLELPHRHALEPQRRVGQGGSGVWALQLVCPLSHLPSPVCGTRQRSITNEPGQPG